MTVRQSLTPNRAGREFRLAALSVLAFGLRDRLRYRGLLRHRHADATPDEVDGDARQDDDESGPSLRRLVDEEHEEYDSRAGDVEHWNYGVAEGAVRALGFGPGLPESYDASDCEYVEDEGGGDDVCEEVVVEAPVGGRARRLVRARHDAREHQERRPDALNDEPPSGHVLVVQLPRRAEEQAVARHRVVGARAREYESVVAAEGRDHDGRRHDRRAEAGEDDVRRGRGHSVVRDRLDGLDRQRHEVRDVGEQIQTDN